MVSKTIIETVIPTVEVLNIWSVLVDEKIMQIEVERAKKKRKKK